MKIAILASGGNSQAMNNTIITIVDQAIKNKIKVELIRDGYKGLINE
jgi:6-phosphofructokinase